MVIFVKHNDERIGNGLKDAHFIILLMSDWYFFLPDKLFRWLFKWYTYAHFSLIGGDGINDNFHRIIFSFVLKPEDSLCSHDPHCMILNSCCSYVRVVLLNLNFLIILSYSLYLLLRTSQLMTNIFCLKKFSSDLSNFFYSTSKCMIILICFCNFISKPKAQYYLNSR